MPTAHSKAALSLRDFADLFETLAAAGTEQVVIGGCAVGAYARLLGEQVTSGDLDLYATRAATEAILIAASKAGGRIVKRAQPRSIPVAVVDWKGKELNVLNSTPGLQSPDIEAQLAREFVLRKRKGLSVLVADPFELLANKLVVDRAKDAPHIAILRRFLEGEVVLAFQDEDVPRKRIAPAVRLLRVEKRQVLPAELARKLIKLARLPSDFRFLAHHAPSRETARAVLERAKGTVAETEVSDILKRPKR